MKLPSIQYLAQQAEKGIKKHPLSILSASVAVVFAIFLVEKESTLDNAFPYINLLLCGYLGVPLFLAIDIYTEGNQRSSSFRTFGLVTGMALLVGVYFYLPGSEDTLNKSIPYIRYSILAITAHLLVSFAPFLSRGTLNGFWQFNKVLFLRFLLSALYSGFIYVGLIIALFALDQLFKVDVEEERYAEIFFVVAGVFNTWFFAAGVPSRYDLLDEDINYPKGLRTFILYVLVPLLGLYFLILYSYSFKITLSWNWPSGIITYMIIVVAVLGILAMLLAYPYSLKEEGGPLVFLKKGYYWVLLPMIVMLYLAIGIRVSDYGITINRYITIFLAVWLTGISLYMVFRGKDIRLIPISLFVIILLCSFGPWGLFSVSERSQVKRLEKVLSEAGILQDGKISNEPIWDASDTVALKLINEEANEGILTDSLHNEVMSILDYLEGYHGLNGIAGWFDQNPREIAQKLDYNEDFVAMQLMGLRHEYKYADEVKFFPNFYASPSETRLLALDGYDYIYEFDFNSYPAKNRFDSLSLSGEVSLLLDMTGYSITVQSSQRDEAMIIDLEPVYLKFKEQEGAGTYRRNLQSTKPFILVEENDWISIKIYLESFSVNEDGMTSCEGKMLVGFGD